ncbi:hypothetical protein [Rhodanobacter sp. MP7CTX1]|uniref:hypothetical protein n=1 Tax=Rhodanobacter sp. MP7CTX1 TaxID=2723084 RepID=UPI00161B282A|nr:hypothetical protein [Rhodanobacter sp. MP7CTX1]MBB6185761.1 hypothetical protein [Rhodanobacter sp. MP7CTX1]
MKLKLLANALLGVPLVFYATFVAARTPTPADLRFCTWYGSMAQRALMHQRSGVPMGDLVQELERNPNHTYAMDFMGWATTAPAWVNDVSADASEHCLEIVRRNMRGWLVDDPERLRVEDKPGDFVGGITRLPSKNEAQAPATSQQH